MSAQQPLTADQITFFKEQGYLIQRKLIDPAQIASWQDQFWTHLGADADDPATWPEGHVIEGFTTDPPLSEVPQVKAIVEQLGGGKFAGGDGSMLVGWPKQDQPWSLSGTGHLDGYGSGGWKGGFMLAATSYMHDIEPKGGGFTYWPRSHLSTHDYFLKYPIQIDGSFNKTAEWDQKAWGIFTERAPHGRVEFPGRAGDVIFWHGFLCHCGSPNSRPVPRTGVFSRWYHADREQMRCDIAPDLWKYWVI